LAIEALNAFKGYDTAFNFSDPAAHAIFFA
jgi:hypothetical protein